MAKLNMPPHIGVRFAAVAVLVVVAFVVFAIVRKRGTTGAVQGSTATSGVQYIPTTGDSFTTQAITENGSNNTLGDNSTVSSTNTSGNTATTTTNNPPSPPSNVPPSGPPIHKIHIVIPGDTLTSIAKQYGITLAALEAAPGNYTTIFGRAHQNGVHGREWDHIYVGEPIYIPQ